MQQNTSTQLCSKLQLFQLASFVQKTHGFHNLIIGKQMSITTNYVWDGDF